MAFAKEIEDFLNGYSAMSKIGQDQQTSKIEKEKWALQKDALEQQQMEALATDPTAVPGSKATKKIKVKKVDTAASTVDIPTGDGTTPDDDSDVIPDMWTGGTVPEAIPEFATGGMVQAQGPNGSAMFAGFDRRNRGKRPAIFDQAGPGQAANDQGAVPEQAAAPGQPAETSSNDPLRQAQLDQGHQPSTGKAVKAAVDSFSQDAKGRQAVGGREPEVDLITGRGAASPAEIKAIDQTIDPNGTMDAIQLGRQRLNTAYNYWMSKGFPEKAANVAKRILLFDKNQSMVKGAMAGHMIQAGNIAQGAQVLADAYNQHFHDGKTMQQQNGGNGTINYQFVDDQTGQVVQQGTATAEQLSQMAKITANGSQYVQSTVQAADDEAQKEAGNNPDAPAPSAAAPAATPAPAVPDTPAATPAPAVPDTPAPAAAAAPAAPLAPGLTQGGQDALDAVNAANTPPAPAADKTEPPAQAAAETPASKTPEGAVPDTTTPAEPAKGDTKSKTRPIGSNEAFDRYTKLTSVIKMIEARTDPKTGKLSPEDRKKRRDLIKRRDVFEKAVMDLSAVGQKDNYAHAAQREARKELASIRADTEAYNEDDYTEWEQGRSDDTETKQLVAAAGGKLATAPAGALEAAQSAIDQGAPRMDVIKKLIAAGFNPEGL